METPTSARKRPERLRLCVIGTVGRNHKKSKTGTKRTHWLLDPELPLRFAIGAELNNGSPLLPDRLKANSRRRQPRLLHDAHFCRQTQTGSPSCWDCTVNLFRGCKWNMSTRTDTHTTPIKAFAQTLMPCGVEAAAAEGGQEVNLEACSRCCTKFCFGNISPPNTVNHSSSLPCCFSSSFMTACLLNFSFACL